MTIDVQRLSELILAETASLAANLIGDYTKEANADVAQFMQDNQDNLATWTAQLALGELNQDDFNDLVQTSVVDGIFHAIKRSGLEQVDIDKFKQGLVKIITDVVTGTIEAAVKASG